MAGRRREEAQRRLNAKVPVATHQRAPLHRTSFTDPVWAMLDLRFSLLLLAFLALYAVLIVMWALITWAAVPQPDASFKAPVDFSGPATYFAFVASNIVTMGFGTVSPLTHAGFWVGTLQHLSGVLLNVLVFTIISGGLDRTRTPGCSSPGTALTARVRPSRPVTRVMHPTPDLAFSSRALVLTRDGVVTLVFRVANLRCNCAPRVLSTPTSQPPPRPPPRALLTESSARSRAQTSSSRASSATSCGESRRPRAKCT